MMKEGMKKGMNKIMRRVMEDKTRALGRIKPSEPTSEIVIGKGGLKKPPPCFGDFVPEISLGISKEKKLNQSSGQPGNQSLKQLEELDIEFDSGPIDMGEMGSETIIDTIRAMMMVKGSRDDEDN